MMMLMMVVVMMLVGQALNITLHPMRANPIAACLHQRQHSFAVGDAGVGTRQPLVTPLFIGA